MENETKGIETELESETEIREELHEESGETPESDSPQELPILETESKPVSEEDLIAFAESQGLNEIDPNEVPEDAEPVDLSALSDEQQSELMASMEAVLFMSDKPVSLPKLRSTINPEVSLKIFRSLMAKLREEFSKDFRGVEIAEFSLGFQLRTKPHMSSVLRKMVKTTPLKLSGTTMEVLSIVAYKQPVTKDEIDQIRGVDSGYVLRNLMEKRLLKITGRSDLPGKPMIYSTTHEFLELFNLKDLKSLPALHEIEAMVAQSEVGFDEKMNTVMENFSKMVESSTDILFDDSQIDEELEALRAEIANVPTSTTFLEEQKAKEKRDAKLQELALQGMTLDENDNVVPIGYVSAIAEAAAAAAAEEPEIQVATTSTDEQEHVQTTAETMSDYTPSPELVQAAEEAEKQRHAEAIDNALEDPAPPAEPRDVADEGEQKSKTEMET